jgi:hypothetical protein
LTDAKLFFVVTILATPEAVIKSSILTVAFFQKVG